MLRVTDILAAFFPDEDETIHLRAFKPKDAPSAPNNHALVEVVTRRRLAHDADLQRRMTAANKTRGWYFVVNSGGNADADITHFNTFFVESDSLPVEAQHRRLDAAPLRPSVRLQTRKSVHAYWPLDGECDADSWRDVQERLIAYFDGDKSIKNPSRVMRLPFFNYVHFDTETGDCEFKRIELHTFEPERRFTLAEMREAFPQIKKASGGTEANTRKVKPAPEVSESIPRGSRHKELLSLAGSMRRRGMGAEEMAAALTVTNQKRCQPPLDETEVLELCRDVTHRYMPEETAHYDGSPDM